MYVMLAYRDNECRWKALSGMNSSWQNVLADHAIILQQTMFQVNRPLTKTALSKHGWCSPAVGAVLL